jgi:phenylpropionate dioxygenase-like ring-hydroxylating dioxygenase large terminal subunit
MFLHNAWYVGATAEEVSRKPQRRRILNEPVVFYRRENGAVVAIADSCPHRFAQLSAGFLVGDDIECRYHGLRFSPEGHCVRNPHGPLLPKRSGVRVYRTAELLGVVWIWMGDAERADDADIPDYSSAFRAEPLLHGYAHILGHHMLLTDNLMDGGSHVDFVHTALKATGDYTRQVKVSLDGDTVLCQAWWINADIPPFMRLTFPDTTNADIFYNLRWNLPGIVLLTIGLGKASEPGTADGGFPALHMFTPETETTSHYFYITQPWGATSPEASEMFRASADQAFKMEDQPLIEGQQENMGAAEYFSLRPALLSCDAASVAARRLYQRKVDEERGISSVAASVF